MTKHTITSRKEAKAAGLTRYCNGKLCVHGHICDRLTSSGGCVKCTAIRAKAWRVANIEGRRKHDKKYYETNVDKILKRNRIWDAANVEWRRDWNTKWREENEDKIRERNRKYNEANAERRSKTSKAWRQANPDAFRAALHARRARKLGAEGQYTKFDLHELLEKQGLSCYCGVSFLITDSTVDHVVPLSRGGSNWPKNLQLLCGPCNDSKGTKTMEEWKKAA